MDDNPNVELVAEQLRRLQDNLSARLDRLEQSIQHNRDLTGEQISSLRQSITDLRSICADHEARIRSNTDAATGFRLWTGGAGIASLIALVKSFLP